jgi:hypothetical protein
MPPELSSLLFVGTQIALRFHYTESDCIKWYVFQEVGTQLLIAAVELILIIRGMPFAVSTSPPQMLIYLKYMSSMTASAVLH